LELKKIRKNTPRNANKEQPTEPVFAFSFPGEGQYAALTPAVSHGMNFLWSLFYSFIAS